MPNPLTCILCVHWRFDGGEPDYSTLTPGSDWASYCARQVWRANGHRETEETYRAKLLTANRCQMFVRVPSEDHHHE